MLRKRLKSGIRRWTPKLLFNMLEYQRQRMGVASIPRNRCDCRSLGELSENECRNLFELGPIDGEWKSLVEYLQKTGIWNNAFTVGSVDLKVLYYLARRCRFRSVLEIGTHIGGSAVTLTSALGKHVSEGDKTPELVTIDIEDVNNAETGPWSRAGMQHPPRDVVAGINTGVDATFVTSSSTTYLEKCDRTFDFIFIDGDHRGDTTYIEIGLALERINPGGLIALHDYSSRVLFSKYLDGYVIPGPYLAARRILSEHPDVEIRTFEQVPWLDGLRVSYAAVMCKKPIPSH